ncbi:glyceraldehyde-3-phosphate dehydrogenase [Actinoplanes lobatus]|uniref:Glyceraldehyde-3-phosphate dehydrogenase n=1 Tax=Actinoplanes lobatus TaxID=113568 RepID=A0A7W7HEW0_9ACTN|nr:type I glyceraldehyde-3-phosphate dehydrogenase [Actinoplanes lobatus]MBB4749273.1 glyceraldehyde 3-phosphate dehydrogenase [Actinoplanes lobatus]GGN80016.1 glyceraldehyde-3-phosphate dehydrogenase [Actinoplanes lobatus]GIE40212.1 glyceraldehyde-3-phosphate dehydrogenase [Actinoplanes lobatus]
MTVAIGINGLGRIGRSVTRIVASASNPGVQIAAVNDVASTDKLAYGLRRDSVRGAFPGTVTASGDYLVVNDHAIRAFHHERPERIPWAEEGVDVVIEATGRFRAGSAARFHITHGGARKVVISASADDPDAFLVVGANHKSYDPALHDVVSPASCGVNALTVMAKVLLDRFGLRSVNTSVMLAAQSWQRVQDSLVGTSREDPRLGRAAGESIIPHNYVVGDLVRVALPEIGEMRYSYYCVPTPIGSLAELSGQTDRPVTADEVNRAMAEAAAGPLRGILAYDPDPTVSIDVKNNPASCLFDPSGTQTTADGGVKVRGWFDNEWGFSNRLLDLARLVGDRLPVPSSRVTWSVA